MATTRLTISNEKLVDHLSNKVIFRGAGKLENETSLATIKKLNSSISNPKK
jgi:hypothetical protein